jgi:HD-GYP domain-containing protein (c-di-GMP phosphodiesterase class II)
MSDGKSTQAKRYPLHLTIAFAFTALLLLIGLALITFNYLETRKIAILGADDLLERTSLHLQTSIAELYVPAQNLVDVLSKAVSAEETDLEDRLANLPLFAEPLLRNPTISAVFVGYENGDFFLVTSALSRGRQVPKAPPEAVFVAQSIDDARGGSANYELYFFDEDLELLGRGEMDRQGYDPRQREWYEAAIATDQLTPSAFYLFFTTRQVGITMARRLPDGGGVVGADLALGDLEEGLAHLRVTPSSRLAIFDKRGGVIALSDPEEGMFRLDQGEAELVEMPRLAHLEDPAYRSLGEAIESGLESGRHELEISGETWVVSLSPLPTRSGDGVSLAVLIPRNELLTDAIRVRNQSTLISLGLLLAAVALVIGVSRHIARSINALAQEAEDVREFKLDNPITVRSRIKEVDDLAATMGVMKSSIQQFLAISQALSAEKDYRRLLEMILAEARNVARAEGGAILLESEDETELEIAILENEVTGADFGGTAREEPRFRPLPLQPPQGEGEPPSVDRATVHEASAIRIDDISEDRSYDFKDLETRFAGQGFQARSLLSVPLKNQLDEVIGVLQLVNARTKDGTFTTFSSEIVPYIEALSSDAAVALDIRRLLKVQRDLLDALIHMIAGAIDAKSPYTHGHCQRVPVIARMLAEVAHDTEEGQFADFNLSEDEWYELHLASWLHDCGKVTTPEYVVDKATKLETIYNRIHEIRMRFEVLWRDAQIEYYRGLLAGKEGEAMLEERLDQRLEELRSDFEFVAECNLGGEFMSEDRVERLQAIASQTWMRNLDDRLGLSHLELEPRQGEPETPLPVEEHLLADKPEHVIARSEAAGPFGEGPHDFRMDVPTHQYNRGELHNLSISRGTLTDEERFKINEHVVQTILMLRRLPLPRELRRVPDWAGTHHEKLDGTGYPRRLGSDELSVPERIMAIADIFEALTAADRPYHAPKTLSKAIWIMSSMCAEGHLCPGLFGLFLRSGLYLEYAQQYLQPEQIDEVDVEAVIQSVSANQVL